MRKTFMVALFGVALILCSASAKSQIIKPGFTIGLGAAYAQPVGDFKKGFKYGFGGDVYGGVGWGKTYLLATLGYRGFIEDVSTNANTLSYVPVKLGVRQYLLLKKIYIQANAGVANISGGGESSSAFTYDLGAGLKFAGFEIAAFYDSFKPKDADKYLSSINGRIGYNFSF